MKLPKVTKKYCKKCKKAQEHKITQAKRKTPFSKHPMSQYGKNRAKVKGRLGAGNHGKFSKPPDKKMKMHGKKQSKKIDLRFSCKECKTSHITTQGFRAKKVEFT